MTATLTKYEAARAALAEARSVDEVKDIHDKAEAIRAYARMAEDTQLEADAAELRLRAERRLGLMLQAEKDAGRLAAHRPRKSEKCSDEEQLSRLTLDQVGIDRKLSSRAQKVASIAERAFEAAVERKRQEILKAKGRVSLDLTGEDKKQRRADKEKILGGIQMALPKRRFGVILADPEWRFEPYSRESGMDRAADNHYPTSVTEVIAARPVADIAADDCVLFLWATVPMLPDALQVMAAWGFAYKSHAIWNKDRIGTGYWFRNKHELLLIGTRGNIPAPAMGSQWPSVSDAPVGRHSAKPEIFLELIETYFPTLPKIELNRRGATRKGWCAWGNEAEPGSFDQETGELTDEGSHDPDLRDLAGGDGAGVPEADSAQGEVSDAVHELDSAGDAARNCAAPGAPVAVRPVESAAQTAPMTPESDPWYLPDFLKKPKTGVVIEKPEEVPFQ